MNFSYNPIDKNYCKSGGTLPCGNTFFVHVKTTADYCSLIIENDKSKQTAVYRMNRVNGGFSVAINGLKTGLYFYYFNCGGQLFGKGGLLNAVQYEADNINKYQLTVYKRNYNPPKWLNGGLIYQIFPDRFNKFGNCKVKGRLLREWGEEPFYKPNSEGKILNNDFFGGNFKGIIKKLDYLKDLGVTAIYLNPISLAYSNHRYDTANYLKIDSLLGSEDDLRQFINSAHRKGIKVIFDGVYNHTGDDSVYFNKYGNFDSVGAYQSKKSKYYNWFTFQDYPNEYTSWWGINVLPTVNKNCKQFEDFICEKVLPYYFSFGFYGVRLDVVDELPSRFVKRIRKTVKKLNPNAIIIGEVWEDATNKIAYGNRREYFQGDELDSVMNYPLKNAIINYVISGNNNQILSVISEQLNNYPKKSLQVLMNVLGTHDTARILTVLSGKNIPEKRDEARLIKLSNSELKLATKRLKVAFAILFTLYGVPTVYYGDERGMQGAKDPFNRRCLDFNVNDKEIYSFIKKLSKIRIENAEIFSGDTKILACDSGVLSFKRYCENKEITVIVNAGNNNYTVNAEDAEELLTKTAKKTYDLEKYSILILKRR